MGSITSTGKATGHSNPELEVFIIRARSSSIWTAWGMFCDAIGQREWSNNQRRKDRWGATVAAMWNVVFNPEDPNYIGQRGTDEVGPLLWVTVGRLCKYGHPMPENVTRETLQDAVYVERRKEWRENYAAILGIEPGTVTVDDLTKGL